MPTWTHFTSYLDGSRPITKLERRELVDQLAARLTEASASLTINYTNFAVIEASDLMVDLVSHNGDSEIDPDTSNFNDVLFDVAPYFSNFYTLRSTALAAEGLNDTTLGGIISNGFDSYRRWNFYRRMIDGLTP